MNYKEVLEAIAYGIHITDDIEGHLRDLATQALAPQECDVDKKYLKEILEELNCDAKWAVQNIKSLRKQLHSQEKTFTLEEIKDRLSTLIEDDYLDDLLVEFEKEGSDERRK